MRIVFFKAFAWCAAVSDVASFPGYRVVMWPSMTWCVWVTPWGQGQRLFWPFCWRQSTPPCIAMPSLHLADYSRKLSVALCRLVGWSVGWPLILAISEQTELTQQLLILTLGVKKILHKTFNKHLSMFFRVLVHWFVSWCFCFGIVRSMYMWCTCKVYAVFHLQYRNNALINWFTYICMYAKNMQHISKWTYY